ncbi:pentapeptide repeat-containing protein [Zafaria sp. J156]|uniref:pentapeptide repeat-containing protein n=1 Tax=Zafaria sp. J156 TaxID=3116490 RepID=UPI002E77A12E|nr:pentapeptide repeat-containing protein [Zafaria sp. J156]MEE1621053.1 pentapeptide repeat-containing protein [Zafaria sp. J156]
MPARPAPQAPRLPSFAPASYPGAGDLTALDADGRCEGLLFEQDDAAGADLEDAVFTACSFRGVSLAGARLERASFGDCRFEELLAPTLSAPDSAWWNTRIARGRIGSAELYGATLRSVLFDGGKLGYVNLRSAELKDVLFRDVIIEELDLGSATATRVAFEDCRIDSLLLHGARLSHADLRGAGLRSITAPAGLRGATIDALQLQDLAPLLAAEAGIRVL